MKNYVPWIILGAVTLFILGLFGGLFLLSGGHNLAYGIGCANDYSMMGYWGMPMMRGWALMPLGFLGMVIMWLVPLGVLALIAGGIFWIVRALTRQA